MEIRVVTLRYQDAVQGFAEEALRQATFGRTVLDVREHFFCSWGNPPSVAGPFAGGSVGGFLSPFLPYAEYPQSGGVGPRGLPPGFPCPPPVA